MVRAEVCFVAWGSPGGGKLANQKWLGAILPFLLCSIRGSQSEVPGHKQQQHLCELVRNTNSPGLTLDLLNQTLWGQGPALLRFNEPSRGFGGSSCENLQSSLKSFPGFDASASFL